MRNYKDNLIVKMTIQFSLSIIEFSEALVERKKFVFADQILRSGCAIGSNEEAQSAESKADFIHKLKIASKEAEEVEYWLDLCEFAKNYPKPGKLLDDVGSILKVIGKIISTSRRSTMKA